jgi:hypothetical protein
VHMSAAGNFVGPQLVPPPAAGAGWGTARAIENPFLQGAHHDWKQVRAIGVRTESNQISRTAFRTLHAMTDTPSHDSTRCCETNRCQGEELDVNGL